MVYIVDLILLKLCTHLWEEVSFILQLLGVCHCWWTKESPRAHVATFYGRLGWFVAFERIKVSVLKLSEIAFVGVYYTIPFGFSLFRHFLAITFQLFKFLCLANDHWWGSSTQNAYMIHIVNEIWLKLVYMALVSCLSLLTRRNLINRYQCCGSLINKNNSLTPICDYIVVQSLFGCFSDIMNFLKQSLWILIIFA